MGPGWNKTTPSLWPDAAQDFRCRRIWQYEQARGALDAAGRLINTELAERRNLILAQSGAGNDYGTVRTLVAAYQMIMPGEWARAHRHTPNALRLILDAEPGTYTEVDGVNIAMEPGDVLLTPNWSCARPRQRQPACAYWLDFLDVPLVQLLEPMFFEPQSRRIRAGQAAGRAIADAFPVGRDQEAPRRGAARPNGCFGTQIEFGNPALATTALHMMQLDAGSRPSPIARRRTISIRRSRARARRSSKAKSFPWARGDMLVVPSWLSHLHRASKDAVLFRVTDTPTMEKLGFLRDECPAANAY